MRLDSLFMIGQVGGGGEVRFTVYDRTSWGRGVKLHSLFMVGQVGGGGGGGEVKGIRKVKTRQVDVLSADAACKAISWPTPVVKMRRNL